MGVTENRGHIRQERVSHMKSLSSKARERRRATEMLLDDKVANAIHGSPESTRDVTAELDIERFAEDSDK